MSFLGRMCLRLATLHLCKVITSEQYKFSASGVLTCYVAMKNSENSLPKKRTNFMDQNANPTLKPTRFRYATAVGLALR